MIETEKDPLLRLEALIPRIERAVEGKILGGTLAVATQAVESAQDRLRRLGVLTAFVPVIIAHADRQVIEVTLEAIEELGRALETAQTMEQFKSLPRELQIVLTRDLQNLEREVEQAWKGRIFAAVGPTERLGDVLSKIDEKKKIGEELVKVSRDADALGAAISDAGKQVQLLEKLQARASKAKQAAATGEAAVDQFLFALAEQRATLADVTPAVLAWAKRVGALKQFTVTL